MEEIFFLESRACKKDAHFSLNRDIIGAVQPENNPSLRGAVEIWMPPVAVLMDAAPPWDHAVSQQGGIHGAALL